MGRPGTHPHNMIMIDIQPHSHNDMRQHGCRTPTCKCKQNYMNPKMFIIQHPVIVQEGLKLP